MNCEHAKRLLDFEDEHARPDLAGLRRHIDRCAACRTAYPELALLLPPEESGASRSSALRVAAAAIFLIGAGLALQSHAPQAKEHRTPFLVSSLPTDLRSPAFTLTVRSTSIERNRVTTSTWIRRSGGPVAP